MKMTAAGTDLHVDPSTVAQFKRAGTAWAFGARSSRVRKLARVAVEVIASLSISL